MLLTSSKDLPSDLLRLTLESDLRMISLGTLLVNLDLLTQMRGKTELSFHRVVELTCSRQMHAALLDCSAIPMQGTPCIGHRVRNCHVLNPVSLTHLMWLGKSLDLLRHTFLLPVYLLGYSVTLDAC